MIYTCIYFSDLSKKTFFVGTYNEYPQHMFSSRNRKNVNFRASKSWLDKWILTIFLSMDK